MEKDTFQEFENVSYEAWKQLAEKNLKKEQPWIAFFTDTYENITLKPLYTKRRCTVCKIYASCKLIPYIQRYDCAGACWK
ncbi:hypothetical protein GCM10020331_041380 [Ectobacillus funiculus]